MGKYLSFANECIQNIKPAIEKKIGIKLEDVVAKEAAEYPGYDPGDIAAMFVTGEYRGTIFVNERRYHEVEAPLSRIIFDVAHELAHFAHWRIQVLKIARDILKKASGKYTESSLREAREYSSRSNKSEAFSEGFAEHISLKSLYNLYDKEVRDTVIERMSWLESGNHPKATKPHARGYKFYSKACAVSEAGVLEIARSPPICELEVRIPLLYLLRRFPAKTIRKMPRLIAENIKYKCQKAYYKYKYGTNLVHL